MVGSNDELLIEILRRLPAKCTIRFKSVSKHWQTLLSQHYFTLLFDSLSISHGFLFHNSYITFDVENQSTKPFDSLDFYPDPLGIRIVQSCNGLLLCCTDKGTESTRKYYVFNPTTKQFAVIPPLIGNDYCKDIRFIGLAFHQTNCVNFKVVCVYRAYPEGKLFQIQIYSADTGKWRILRISYMDPFWINESRGHLHLTETDITHGILNVYEMLSDHSGRVLKYQVEHHELLAGSRVVLDYRYYEFEILDVFRGEKEADSFMLVRILDKIMKYDILDKSFKLIFDLKGIILPNCRVKAYRYIESIGSF